MKIYSCCVHSCFGRHYVLWKFCTQLSLTFFCGLYFRSVVYEDFQFKAVFQIVSQDNAVQSQPLFQERLCIISVCVCVCVRERERERETYHCVFVPPLLNGKWLNLSVYTPSLCIVLLSLHDMFQPVILGHLQVDCVQKHILRHCIFALCVSHVKENKISVLMNFLTHGV